ncbi:RNA polymerase sigma factor [Chitinophaga rhizosphaerae]|uniref:RNA polymerase sigma factor n=1 Tax=Chitinophaga rhizosphaerae TaxID=1864947 RepID=UPI000F804109|nr:sigma-70 family RNA polymerase sigma factor [Chitinophaga rhizosphaerae]
MTENSGKDKAMTTAEILSALHVRDERALVGLRAHLGRPLKIYAIKVIGDIWEAEELVNDIFLSLWAKAENFKHFEEVRNYLFRAIRLGSLRKRKNLNKRDLEAATSAYENLQLDIAEAEIRAKMFDKLYAAIEYLPKGQKLIVELTLVHDMRPAQIAKALGISPRTVRNQKNDALKALRKRMFPASATRTNRNTVIVARKNGPRKK